MKKILLSLLVIISACASAQPLILTQAANEPAVADMDSNFDVDTSMYTSGLPISVTGSASVWNFTQLQALNPAFVTTYDSPASVPSATPFTGCTVVQNDIGLFTYFKSTTTPTPQTEILGVTSTSLSLTFTNSAIAIRYPMSFGSSITDNMAGSFSAFSYSGTCSGSITTTADGTGTLMLPNGVTLTNVLRVKSVQKLSFSEGFFPIASGKQTIYSYYHASKKFPVLIINYNSIALIATSPTVTSFVTGNSSLFTASGTVGLKENALSSASLEVYPNPFSQSLSLQISSSLHAEDIKIYSQLGQVVYQQSYSGIISPDLQSGIYFIEVKTAQGVLRKKLIRQ